jgi:hypothetical protein
VQLTSRSRTAPRCASCRAGSTSTRTPISASRRSRGSGWG